MRGAVTVTDMLWEAAGPISTVAPHRTVGFRSPGAWNARQFPLIGMYNQTSIPTSGSIPSGRLFHSA